MIAIIGLVGSIASIIALFLPGNGWRMRITHAAYVFIVFILACVIVHRQSELQTLKKKLEVVQAVERAANDLVNEKRMMTSEGFINASLAFLEKNQIAFPDAYKRAQDICNKNDVFTTDDKIAESGGSNLRHAWSKIEVASALSGILEGIAAVSESEH